MESYAQGVRRRLREGLVVVAQVIPIFAITAYFSTLEKALIASTIIWSIWCAVAARKEGWRKPGFWLIVACVGAANAIVIWTIPLGEPFKAGIAVAYPLAMAEGFAVYWLLGWWLRSESEID